MKLIWLAMKLAFSKSCPHFSDIYCQCGRDKAEALKKQITEEMAAI